MAHGGRIAPDNRGPQAKGVGKNSKRHDLERRSVPFLHGSDLQQGDVQAMEQGQRIAPKQTQQPAQPQRAASQSVNQTSQGVKVPDAIEFLAGRQSGPMGLPRRGRAIENHQALNWLPLLRQIVVGPGSSGLLASAFINQAREIGRVGSTPATIIDLDAVDDGIEAMLDSLQ